MGSKIVISIEFLEDLIELPKDIQKKTIDFLYKFDKNPQMHGIHFEQIHITIKSEQLYSVQIDDNYRGIIYKDDQNNLSHLLWVLPHKEVYKSSGRKKTFKNGNLLVNNKDYYDKQGITKNKSNNLFSSVSNRDLLSFGVEEKYLPLIRRLENDAALQEIKEIIPNDVYSNLELKAIKIHVNEIKAENNRQKKELINIFRENVLSPALKSDIEQDIKDSIQNTIYRIESKKSVQEIIDFYEDALKSIRGKFIRDKLNEKKLDSFEDIEPIIRDFIQNNRLN